MERSGYIWPLPSSLLFLPCPRNLLVTIFIAEWLSSFRCGAWLNFPKLPCAYMLLLCVLPRSLTFFSCASLQVHPSGLFSRKSASPILSYAFHESHSFSKGSHVPGAQRSEEGQSPSQNGHCCKSHTCFHWQHGSIHKATLRTWLLVTYVLICPQLMGLCGGTT